MLVTRVLTEIGCSTFKNSTDGMNEKEGLVLGLVSYPNVPLDTLTYLRLRDDAT